VAWPEIFPYMDAKAAQSAAKFGVQADQRNLARLMKNRDEYARIVAALVREPTHT
jgi:hypothetical protein